MTDEQAIAKTIQTYFDSMFLSVGDKVHQAFHPNAKITDYMGTNLLEQTVDEFASFVGDQSPSTKSQGRVASSGDLARGYFRKYRRGQGARRVSRHGFRGHAVAVAAGRPMGHL